jgi:putative ABC transport system permease protein
MRTLFVAVRLAFRSIQRNALRATLTVLGILIGVASVTTVTALGAGARGSVGKQLDSVGSNVIYVFPESAVASGARSKAGGRLTEEDGRAIKRDAVSVAQASWEMGARIQVVSGDSNTAVVAVGAILPYFEIHNWKFARGEPWTEHDEATKAKVCVIGETVRIQLFGTEDPVGRTLRMGRYPCRIIGLLEPKGEIFGNDQDNVVVTPLAGFRSRFTRAAPGQVNLILLSSTSSDTTDRAIDQVKSILRQRHHIGEGHKDDFGVRAQQQFQEMQATIFSVLTLLLVSVAAISLLVGGIGIMNIMLVSVTERTREIGIRMAIGARENDIRTQFLVEAVVLSLLGGLAGAALGTLAIAGLGKALQWPMSVSPTALGISAAVSAIIGITFGFFPARRASKMDPIVALRHE